MAYQAPLQDIRFVLNTLAGLADVQALPGFEEASTDLVDAVLEENARFVQEVIAPLNHPSDEQGATWHDGEVKTTPGFGAAFRGFAEGGWQGLQHEAAYGGQGLPKTVGTPCIEMLNSGSLSFALCPLLTDGVIEALMTAGSDEQKQQYLPQLVSGQWTGTMNLTEPQAGSDLALVRSRAEPQDDGTYRVFGQKIFITYGEHDLAENIIHLVLARVPGAPEGIKGISLFIVPKFLVNDDGSLGARNDVWCASLEHKLGIHGSPTAVLLYGDEHGDVGKGAVGYLVGEENRGLEYMFVMMNAARFAVGVQGLAVAERATQQAEAYARERLQSRSLDGGPGAAPIIDHPDVQRMLLTMRGLTEGARATAYVAAGIHDLAHHHPDPEVRREQQARYEYLVPIVKGFSTESSLEVTSLGVQVHGGMGFIEETGAAQFYRDARILPIYEGTTAIQANDLVGRKTVRDGGAVAQAFIGQMRETVAALTAAHDPALARIATRLEEAVQAYADVVEFVAGQARDQVRAVYAGSVPYLMLAGLVHAGWHLARAALAVQADVAAGGGSAFLRRKWATARFYADHLLPRVGALRVAILDGSDSVTAEAFAQ